MPMSEPDSRMIRLSGAHWAATAIQHQLQLGRNKDEHGCSFQWAELKVNTPFNSLIIFVLTPILGLCQWPSYLFCHFWKTTNWQIKCTCLGTADHGNKSHC